MTCGIPTKKGKTPPKGGQGALFYELKSSLPKSVT